jgi:hypothetical protein
MSGTIRKYSARKDRKAVQRIWRECGWIEDSKKELEALDRWLSVSNCYVYEMGGDAECLVVSTPGRFHHTGTRLGLSAITAVTTSRVARNQGAASRALARLLQDEARAGANVSGLGIFEQGFYNRLGYGNGTYEQLIRFDPAWLRDMGKPPVPVRLTSEDWKEIHEARFTRRKLHGAVDLLPPEVSRCEMDWMKNSFGLGFREGGKLTHYFVAHASDVESGPYIIDWMTYRDMNDLRDLLALIRGLGDQVRQVRIREPRGVQIQSLLRKPFQLQDLTRNSKYPARVTSVAYWQLRMLDLPACIAALECVGTLEFVLRVTDPIRPHLQEDPGWTGCGGEYLVRLGPESTATLVTPAEPGAGETRAALPAGLPVLNASINDVTRFWMGAASAEVLAGLGSFEGPPELIRALDETVNVPAPSPDWDY